MTRIFHDLVTRRLIIGVGGGLLYGGLLVVAPTSPPVTAQELATAASPIDSFAAPHDQIPSSIYEVTIPDIDGRPVSLSRFKGQVVMIVNTASFCGNTPQYAGLQTLFERYRDRGFTILAFPANDFGKQEPGSNAEIAEFCYTKYALEFPLFSKITVLGDKKHPLYRYLTERTPFPGEITWNFQKFLIDRTGSVIARYRPGMKPLASQIVADIEAALGAT